MKLTLLNRRGGGTLGFHKIRSLVSHVYTEFTSPLQAFEDLGSRMREWYGKTDYYQKLDNTLNYLGYWTDNGEILQY